MEIYFNVKKDEEAETYISKLLAKRLNHVVYLYKDTLITLYLKMKLSEKNANLVVVWVETSPEVVHERMIRRNSERDTWKLAHWDDPKIKDDLLIIKNDNPHELELSMKEALNILEDNV